MLNRKYTTDVGMAMGDIDPSPPGVMVSGPVDNYTPGSNGIDGRKLFKQNCAVCHSLTTVPGTGPGLDGVLSRVPSEEWLHNWIKDADAMKKSGDAYANHLDKIFSGNMSSFAYMSDEEINALIEYLRSMSGPVIVIP